MSASSSTCTPFRGEVRTRGWLLAVVRNLVTTSSHAKPRVGIVLDRSDLLHLGRLARSTGTRTYVLQVTFIVETLSFDADDWLLQDFLFPGPSRLATGLWLSHELLRSTSRRLEA